MPDGRDNVQPAIISGLEPNDESATDISRVKFYLYTRYGIIRLSLAKYKWLDVSDHCLSTINENLASPLSSVSRLSCFCTEFDFSSSYDKALITKIRIQIVKSGFDRELRNEKFEYSKERTKIHV